MDTLTESQPCLLSRMATREAATSRLSVLSVTNYLNDNKAQKSVQEHTLQEHALTTLDTSPCMHKLYQAAIEMANE